MNSVEKIKTHVLLVVLLRLRLQVFYREVGDAGWRRGINDVWLAEGESA